MRVKLPWWHPRAISIAILRSLTCGMAWVTHIQMDVSTPVTVLGRVMSWQWSLAPFLLPDKVAESPGGGQALVPRMKEENKLPHLWRLFNREWIFELFRRVFLHKTTSEKVNILYFYLLNSVLHCLWYRGRLDSTSLDCRVHDIYSTWVEVKTKPKPNTGIHRTLENFWQERECH